MLMVDLTCFHIFIFPSITLHNDELLHEISCFSNY